jgi:tetratricopeptide (TPR) repeat protein
LERKAVFRIDVARDADVAFLNEDYENALSLYQIVLQNDSLLEWEHLLDRPEGTIDRFAARNRMSAYAYYRLTLVYLAQNNTDEATKAYNELQRRYGGDEATRPYAEMAMKFWDAFQSSMNLGDACKQAVAFAESEPVVLSPFDNVFDDAYSPANICPVK